MSYFAYAYDAERMRPTTPCLKAVYAKVAALPSPPRPTSPCTELIITIDPPAPLRIIDGAVAATVCHTTAEIDVDDVGEDLLVDRVV
jgi:hypothetical protein